MHGLKDVESAIQFTDGFIVYYNFFRPHEGLNGATPAEAAGIDYKIKNWADLSRLPVSKQAEIKSHDPLKIMQRITGQPSDKQILRAIDRATGSIPTPKLHRHRGHWR